MGGYDDWLRQRKPVKTEPTKNTDAKLEKADASPATPTQNARKKLSYKEQRELDTLPQTIEKLEQKLASLHQQLADPTLYQQGADKMVELQNQATETEQELEQAFERWAELDAR